MFWDKKKVEYVPVPIPECSDQTGMMIKVRVILESPEFRNYLRQRIAIAAAQVPVYMKSNSMGNMVKMLGGKIEELSYLLETAVRDIDTNLESQTKDDQEDVPIEGNFTNRIQEDIVDQGG